ncbi:MAG: LysR substrate-binding domain-containing protein [Paludibacteraceae bacterium]|nr:LysR substrate-binding domain-containing protein [Paludibacteraceae bacterium]
MDFRLRVFESVANNKSFTRAAEELHISQPAISKHIQELEALYQVCLFERTAGANVRITKEGELLLLHAQRILDAYRQMEYEMNLLTAHFAGELRIGASSTISQYVLPPILASFLKKFPQVKLTVISGNSLQIEKALLAKKIDLGLVEGVGKQLNLKYSPFLKDELVAITSVKSNIARFDEIDIKQLQRMPLVVRENGSGTLDVIKAELQRQGLRLSDLSVMMQLGSTESIKLFLENTDSLGIVSIRSVSKDIYSGRFKVVDIKGMEFLRMFQFIVLQGKSGGIEEDFMRFALHAANS